VIDNPPYVDDFISDTQVQGSSGGVCSSVYAMKFGQGVGVLGLEHGGIQIEKVGELETKDATRWRLWTQSLRHRAEVDGSRHRNCLDLQQSPHRSSTSFANAWLES